MSAFEQERDLLAEVEQLIADGDRRIGQIAAHVEARGTAEPESAATEEMLRVMQEVMERWHAYRRTILDALAQRTG